MTIREYYILQIDINSSLQISASHLLAHQAERSVLELECVMINEDNVQCGKRFLSSDKNCCPALKACPACNEKLLEYTFASSSEEDEEDIHGTYYNNKFTLFKIYYL